MYLSDVDIKNALKTGDIIIEDFDESRLQPASYDVRLGDEFMVFENHQIEYIDPKKDISKHMRKITLNGKDHFTLQPQQFALGVTDDYIGVNEKYHCQLMGKSSLARMGLIIHTTGGFIDPGNALNITLEFFNTNSVPIRLYRKMLIAQVAFCMLKTPAEKPYGSEGLNSKYYNSRKVEASKMHKNY